MGRLILGINAAHADAAAALVSDEGVIAAVAEERLRRVKHWAGFPSRAVAEVLRIGGVDARELSGIAIARDPAANTAARAAYAIRHPRTALARVAVQRRARRPVDAIAAALEVDPDSIDARVHAVEHHVAHVASAFFTSDAERATGVSCDASGDFASHLVARCEGLDVEVVRRTLWPASLGVLYTAVSQYLGFDAFGEEHQVMGLAAYGTPRHAEAFRQLARDDPPRAVALDPAAFVHHRDDASRGAVDGGRMHVPALWGDGLVERLGPPRRRGAPIEDRHRDIAASLQQRLEVLVLAMVERAVAEVGSAEVAYAGGCALNAVANGKLVDAPFVRRLHTHAAAADDGTALGAALYVLHSVLRAPRLAPPGPYLGRAWSEDEVQDALGRAGLEAQRLDVEPLAEAAASVLAAGGAIGWFQGREEWGPRALGHRSIVADPRPAAMRARLNDVVKRRLPFRPFAPAVLEERATSCFVASRPTPLMNVTRQVAPAWRDRLAAITHVDGSARVQTVGRADSPHFRALLEAFDRATGVPVLLNTSFNAQEPIVHTPDEAIACFKRSGLDALAIGPFWLPR